MKTVVALFFTTCILLGLCGIAACAEPADACSSPPLNESPGESFCLSELNSTGRCERRGDLLVARHVEPTKQGTTFRLHTTLENLGDGEMRIERFPVWKDSWQLPQGEASLRCWDSLTYLPHETLLSSGTKACLSSQAYSSQSDRGKGDVPFWRVRSGRHYLFFSLAWCGGWRADIIQRPEGTDMEVVLPPEETQLTLKPGEKIDGPLLYVTAVEADDEAVARAQWLDRRAALAAELFAGPKPWFPFIYNHWYAVCADIDRPFLDRQLEELDRWGFDLFVLDHGWFEKVGDWRPNGRKFKPGELEDYFARLKNKRIESGIWSCPWLQAAEESHFSQEIDEPRFYNRFIDAYSLDIAGMDFKRHLVQHIADLQNSFGIEWWKYDQEFFGQGSRQGKMRKVIALQEALRAVRLAYPQLNIENCMSGGRMINAFTDDIAQSHWIRDGGHSGLEHAQTNVEESLGAAEFLPLAKIQRWINRPDEIDPADDELLKLYCRSAMIGVCGVSADLTKIAPRQRSVILREVAHYRRLNELKTSNIYRILDPCDKKSKTAGIVFYDISRNRAAVLVFRRQLQNQIVENIPLDLLRPDGQYEVNDFDAGEETKVYQGRDLVESGLPISIDLERRSAFYWVKRNASDVPACFPAAETAAVR